MIPVKDPSYACPAECRQENTPVEIACKLTTPEFRKRKATIIAALKAEVLEKRELANGYAYRFAGTDMMLDNLVAFIKSERECCDFLTFHLSLSGDKKETWLELTGPGKVKDFILSELEL
jgi:hypothetical protein